MKATTLRKVKKGDVFKFRPTEKRVFGFAMTTTEKQRSSVIMTTLISVVGMKEKEIV